MGPVPTTLPGFFPPAPRSRIAAGLLVADVALNLINNLVSHFLSMEIRARAVAMRPDEVIAHAGWTMLLGLANFTVVVLTAVYVCLWLHRAFTNLRALRINTVMSPGWAVGSFFVPFVNLVVP